MMPARPFPPVLLSVAPPAGSPTLRRSAASKCVLLAGSLLLIALIAQSFLTMLFILGVVTAAYGVIAVLDRAAPLRLRSALAGGSVAAVLIGLIAANLLGLLSTLTGVKQSLEGQLPLMLGISFYSLQIAGVASDTLRGNIARPQYLDYLVFTLLGFKFYSGPLERADDLDRIVNDVVPLDLDRLWEAFSWSVLGFFMKFVIGNPIVQLIDLNTANPVATWGVATAAELRVYFDFAGYSFMAVGLAKLAGIDLVNNFAQPLYAPNIRDFWHRWHVGLGRWLRHYIYLPARDSMRAAGLSTVLLAPSIFFVSALWHGVTINFALWGTTHALAFLLYVRLLSRYRWPPIAGHVALILLLIFVRLLYIDADAARLAAKLAAFADSAAWRAGWAQLSGLTMASVISKPGIAICLSLIFIALEPLSARRHGTLDYRLFRSVPGVLVMLGLIVLLVHEQPNAIFVYARY